MAGVMEVIVQGVDKLSPVMEKTKNKVNTSMESMQKKFKDAEGSLLAVGVAATAFGAIIVGTSIKFIKMASDAEETSSKFKVVFQSVAEEAEAMAKELSRSYGLGSQSAKQLLSDTGDLLTGFGFTGEMALDLAGEVNKLAVDLASFTNFSGGAKGASQALTKALLGERESVKSLGISILEEDVKAKVALITKQGMTFETERQAKAYATLLIAQEQSKNAIGDYQRTAEGFANQSRELGERLKDLAIAFGERLLPMATKFIGGIKGIVEAITDWTQKHPILTEIIVKFGLALGVLVGSGGLLLLGAIGYMKIAKVIKETMFIWKLLGMNMVALTTKVWAFTASILANPITWWIIGITAVITAIVLLWKNWEKVTEFISRSIDWISEKFKWLGDGIKWIAEKLGIYKEKTKEIIDETGNLGEAVENTKERIEELAEEEELAKIQSDLLKESSDDLGDSLETLGEKAKGATEGIISSGNAVTDNLIALSLKAGDSWADFYAYWEAEAKATADNIKKINKEVEESLPKAKPSNLYKQVDAEGNTIGMQTGNILSQDQQDAGVTLVKMHEGTWKVNTSVPGGEGVALLKDNEVVSQSEGAGWKGATNNIKLEIQAGAIQINGNKIDEDSIRKSGRIIFDEIANQFRANNIILQRG